MTPERIQTLRNFIAGNGSPRETVIIQSKELTVLLDLADTQLRRPQLCLARRNDRFRNGVPKV